MRTAAARTAAALPWMPTPETGFAVRGGAVQELLRTHPTLPIVSTCVPAYTFIVTAPNEITGLLRRWHEGDRAALNLLLPEVYAELRRSAERALRRETPGHTLQATALVHEAWIRLAQGGEPHWQDRQHFLSGAARLMRQVLIDHARRRDAGKRDGGARLTLSGLELEIASDASIDILALDQALHQLQQLDGRKAQLVELRVFAGMEFAEIGVVMDLSRATLDREWRSARAFLWRLLSEDENQSTP